MIAVLLSIMSYNILPKLLMAKPERPGRTETQYVRYQNAANVSEARKALWSKDFRASVMLG